MKITTVPIVHRVPCVGYVMQELDRPGPLDGKKAAKLGARGPQMGMLKNGHDVTLADGTVIKSADVTGAVVQGRKFCMLQDTCDNAGARPYIDNCDVMIHEATCTYTIFFTMIFTLRPTFNRAN